MRVHSACTSLTAILLLALAHGAAAQSAAEIVRRYGSGVNVRWQSPLGQSLTELAILSTAREHDQPYEWTLHEMEGRAVGLDPAVIDIVRHRRPTSGLDDRLRAIVDLARELFGTHALGPDTYARALKALGQANLVDIVSLMANYASTAARLTAFNQQMPPGWVQLLPLPFTPPGDIHADSRSRLPYVKESGLRGLPGPLYSRNLGPEGTGPMHISRHGSGMKLLEQGVGRRMMALAVLVTAHEHHQASQWTAAEAAARRDGVEASVIDVVRRDTPVAPLASPDAAVIQLARELFRDHYVRAETYARALQAFGERNLVDLVDLMAQQVSDTVVVTAFGDRLTAK